MTNTMTTKRDRGRPRGSTYTVCPSLEKTHVTMEQAAQMIGCSPRTVQNILKEGRLVSIKYLNIHRLITIKSIKALIAAESGTGL